MACLQIFRASARSSERQGIRQTRPSATARRANDTHQYPVSIEAMGISSPHNGWGRRNTSPCRRAEPGTPIAFVPSIRMNRTLVQQKGSSKLGTGVSACSPHRTPTGARPSGADARRSSTASSSSGCAAVVRRRPVPWTLERSAVAGHRLPIPLSDRMDSSGWPAYCCSLMPRRLRLESTLRARGTGPERGIAVGTRGTDEMARD